MPGRPISMTRCARLSAAAAAVLLLAGCSSGSNPTSAASSAVAAARSAASALASAAGGLGSAAASAAGDLGSAASAASSAFAGIKGGVDAKSDVQLGTVVTASDGRADVPLTITNHGSKNYRYTVQINFEDQSGSLLDVVVVTAPEVARGSSTQSTARSHRTLSGTVTATVGAALRY